MWGILWRFFRLSKVLSPTTRETGPTSDDFMGRMSNIFCTVIKISYCTLNYIFVGRSIYQWPDLDGRDNTGHLPWGTTHIQCTADSSDAFRAHPNMAGERSLADVMVPESRNGMVTFTNRNVPILFLCPRRQLKTSYDAHGRYMIDSSGVIFSCPKTTLERLLAGAIVFVSREGGIVLQGQSTIYVLNPSRRS